MKAILSLAFAAALLAAPMFAVSTPATAYAPHLVSCNAGTVPAGWLRPGGYCEIASRLASSTGSGGPPDDGFDSTPN